jgi:hypothetical protein
MLANALRARGARVVQPLDFFRGAAEVQADAETIAVVAPVPAAVVAQHDMEDRLRAFFRRHTVSRDDG